MGKRGQLTILVIIALIIVAAVIVIMLYPRISVLINPKVSPSSYLKSCIEPVVKSNIEILSKQGGYFAPQGNLDYKNQSIKYICYTAENYRTCLVQQPRIKGHFEDELNNALAPKAEACAENLKKEYEKRGYSVSLSEIHSNTSIVPGKINIEFSMPMKIKKESTQTFSKFDIEVDSKIYDLLMISTSIIDFESTYGDSETTLYMQYYPDLKIEKIKLSEGSRIYIVSDVVTKESFTFATRSMVWPPGYGFQQ